MFRRPVRAIPPSVSVVRRRETSRTAATVNGRTAASATVGAAILTIVVTAAPAHADCPTDVRELAPTGFLAETTRAITSPGEIDTTPGFQARLDAAAGVRAIGGGAAVGDGAERFMPVARDVDGTAALGGELRGRRGSVAGCVSADLVDVSEGATHVTASGHVPLLFTGLTAAFAFDRDISLALGIRPEFHRAPLSRVAFQLSSSFIDLPLRDGSYDLRVLVVPFSVENALVRQDAMDLTLSRHTSRMSAAMFGFATGDAVGRTAEVDIFRIEVDWNEPIDRAAQPTDEGVYGFARFSLASVTHRGTEWGFELDGGVLSLAGPFDCEASNEDCVKGWFRGALRRSWPGTVSRSEPANEVMSRSANEAMAATNSRWSLEGRLERDAFVGADNLPAVENRASVTAALETGNTLVSGAVFAADTKSWLGGAGGQRAGVRAQVSHALGHGFSGQLDSEVVASNAAMPELASGARLLLSLAWTKQTQR